ncbi:hypothetical protein TNIN_158671 [Trichonephila inaurata madagascariensis]|uniref:Uncharacterized protein n=1 Tax=Trichonephila inaurata madagascariensis TaxID=2747483 RepID=A0A8X6XZB3_9ARAC|nr:hypothetical protein TNIN_158671 [Trichonephila inaurata madagascariensis]
MDTGRVISADYPVSHVIGLDVTQVRDDQLSRSDICILPSDTEDDARLSRRFSRRKCSILFTLRTSSQ